MYLYPVYRQFHFLSIDLKMTFPNTFSKKVAEVYISENIICKNANVNILYKVYIWQNMLVSKNVQIKCIWAQHKTFPLDDHAFPCSDMVPVIRNTFVHTVENIYEVDIIFRVLWAVCQYLIWIQPLVKTWGETLDVDFFWECTMCVVSQKHSFYMFKNEGNANHFEICLHIFSLLFPHV